MRPFLPRPAILPACVLVLSLGITACDTNESEGLLERTYPGTLPVETVTLYELRNNAIVPDTLNVAVYVVKRFICPPCCLCFVADNIVIADTRNPALPEEGLQLFVNNPGQFAVGRKYKMSFEILYEPTFGPLPRLIRRFTLLGYDRL